jgi:hypothetical protein
VKERTSVPSLLTTFDSFECAIHALAPTCEYWGVKVIGHGVEADGRFYCCAHCASMAGAEGRGQDLGTFDRPSALGVRTRLGTKGSGSRILHDTEHPNRATLTVAED